MTTARRLWITGLLLSLGCLAARANVAPTMADQYVLTTQGVPVAFELRAEDADIDPLNPASESLVFVILQGPSHGVLIGDLEDIQYSDPHTGAAKLTYAPAGGFVGTDLLVVAVVDQHGDTTSGTTTIMIDIAADRDEGLLSGSWEANVNFNVQTGEFNVFQTQLTEVYRIDGLTLQGIANIRMETSGGTKEFLFDSLRLVGDLKLDTVNISSTLAFDPKASPPVGGVFDYWRASTSFALLGVNVSQTLYLTNPQTSSYATITTQTTVASASVSNTLRIALDESCSLLLSRNDTMVAWSWCDIGLRASLAMTCNGFERLTFAASEIPLPLFSLLPEGITLGATITFELDKKSLSAQLNWRPASAACIQLMGELATTTLTNGSAKSESITGVTIYGVKLECEIPQGVSFTSATSLHEDYNTKVTGQTDYFEVIRLAGNLAGCCGVPGYWGISTYFHDKSALLFDWGMTVASFDISLAEQLSLSFSLVVRSGQLGGPTSEISAGWSVRW